MFDTSSPDVLPWDTMPAALDTAAVGLLGFISSCSMSKLTCDWEIIGRRLAAADDETDAGEMHAVSETESKVEYIKACIYIAHII